MMEYPVEYRGEPVGTCTVTEQGLYWVVECSCDLISDKVERLYCGSRRLGVLERVGEQLRLHRKLSKTSTPELPPRSGVLSLSPMAEYEPWEGSLLGQPLQGFRQGDTLMFPYKADRPCPCEPLICFFEIKDGFWQLPLRKEWTESKQDGS